jgi:regulatory protein
VCLQLLAVRARSRQELLTALTRRGADADVAAAVLDRLGSVGLVDDAAFAGQWVEERQRSQGRSRRALRDELARKGVDREVVEQAVAAVDAQDDLAAATRLVTRRQAGLARLEPAVARRRLEAMLARRGFDADTVRAALAAVPGPHNGRGETEPAEWSAADEGL